MKHNKGIRKESKGNQRNEPCECGSGIKTKFCCIEEQKREVCPSCGKEFNLVKNKNIAYDDKGYPIVLRCEFCNFFIKGGKSE